MQTGGAQNTHMPKCRPHFGKHQVKPKSCKWKMLNSYKSRNYRTFILDMARIPDAFTTCNTTIAQTYCPNMPTSTSLLRATHRRPTYTHRHHKHTGVSAHVDVFASEAQITRPFSPYMKSKKRRHILSSYNRKVAYYRTLK